MCEEGLVLGIDIRDKLNFWVYKTVIRRFGRADERWVKRLTTVDCEPEEWDLSSIENMAEFIPPTGFHEMSARACKNYCQGSQSSCCEIIDVFLGYIICGLGLTETLRVYPENEISLKAQYDSNELKIIGTVDYTVGMGLGKHREGDAPTPEWHFLVIQTHKGGLNHSTKLKCIAATASLYKRKKEAGKENCSVWGILSSGAYWIFTHIDNLGKFWRSKEYRMNIHEYIEDEVLCIYRILSFIIKQGFEADPHPSFYPVAVDWDMNRKD